MLLFSCARIFSILQQFCLLVLSNLAVVPAVRLSLRLGAAVGAAPAVVLGLNGAASALYHMCDLEVSCGGLVVPGKGAESAWLFVATTGLGRVSRGKGWFSFGEVS